MPPLRAPNGEVLDLDGVWVVDTTEGGLGGKWWIRTFGDCVFATGIDDAYTEDPTMSRSASVQTMRGTIRNDQTIDSTVALLGPHPETAPDQPFAEVRWIIEVAEDGSVALREDREPGVLGPRCPDPSNYCPPPLVLRPQDES
jgi:hypothetical protein